MGNVSNVSVGKPNVSGWLFVAPKGTTLPTDATSALSSTFKDLGFVSEDGITNNNSNESNNIKGWGGQIILTTSTEKVDEFSMTLLEILNEDVLTTVYGSTNVTTGTNTINVVVNASEVPEHVFVIDVKLTGNSMKRIVIPCGKISEMGEIVYKDDEPIGYEITISALPDTSGNNHYEYNVKA